MKRFFVTALFLAAGIVATAQNYPSEWTKFTSGGYFHDIESADDKQMALDQARTNLAKQIQVRVQEVSEMDKNVVNGRSSITYSSQKSLSTDLEMTLTESKSYYNESLGKHFVIVYINKSEACTYYENELNSLIGKMDNALGIADNYVAGGFKAKAKAELERALQLIDETGKPFFWLNVFGMAEGRQQLLQSQVLDKERVLKQKLAELAYSTTYCVVCEADLFGQRYVKLANEVKGALSAQGCNFVDDATQADFVIRIQASAREYNTYKGAYFVYVDAQVTIDKTASNQRIFEDEVSIKGSHTLGYKEAARDGYAQASKQITKLLKDNIQ